MLHVINASEYEEEAPKDYEFSDPVFKKRNSVQQHELTEDEAFAVDRSVHYKAPKPEPVEIVAEPSPIKPGFHQIQEEPIYVPDYEEVNGRDVVHPHKLSEAEAYAVDRAVQGNYYAQSREWNNDMLKNSDFNDYIQDSPSNYPAPRDSVMRLPPNTWERYTFKDEKAAQDAAIAKRAAEYAAEPVAAMQMRSRNYDYHTAKNLQNPDFINEAIDTPHYVSAQYEPWEKLHPRTYNETAYSGDTPTGF
jgi:hypothetical protein